MHLWNIFSHKSSNFALSIVILKSSPFARQSISISASSTPERNFLTFSHSFLTLLIAVLLLEISIPVNSLNSWIQYSTNKLSISCPPKWGSPRVEMIYSISFLDSLK